MSRSDTCKQTINFIFWAVKRTKLGIFQEFDEWSRLLGWYWWCDWLDCNWVRSRKNYLISVYLNGNLWHSPSAEMEAVKMNDTNHARVSVIQREMKSVKNMARIIGVRLQWCKLCTSKSQGKSVTLGQTISYGSHSPLYSVKLNQI